MRNLYLWPGQLALLKETQAREIAVVSGNGYGKTTFGVRWFYDRCVRNYGCRFSLVGAPRQDILDTAILPAFEEYFQAVGLNEKQHYKVLRSKGSTRIDLLWSKRHSILFRSFEKSAARGRVGFTVGHSWIDEPGLCPIVASIEVAKRTRDPKAQLTQRLYTGTPEGLGWFADKFSSLERHGRFSRGAGRLVLHGSTYDNTELDPAYVADLELEFAWNEALRRAYIFGEFVPIYETAGFDFDRRKHVRECPLRTDAPIFLTWDFNVTTGRAGGVSWAAVQEYGSDLGCGEENKGSSRTTDEAADAVIRQLGTLYRETEIIVTGDASGRHRDTRGHGNDFDIIEQKLRPVFPHLQIRPPYSNPSVSLRIAACNRLFSDAYPATLYVDPKCIKIVASFEQTTLSPTGQVVKPPGEQHTHFAEAVGYVVAQLRPIKKPKARRGQDIVFT